MKNFTITFALILLSFLQTACKDNAQVPEAIKDAIIELEAVCADNVEYTNSTHTETLKKIQSTPIEERFKQVDQVDINEDGKMDYIINDMTSSLSCGAIHGARGEGILVFMNTPEGVRKVFAQEVYGSEILENKAYVVVGGRFCDQTDFTVATAKYCKRQLLWDEDSQSIQLGPVEDYSFK